MIHEDMFHGAGSTGNNRLDDIAGYPVIKVIQINLYRIFCSRSAGSLKQHFQQIAIAGCTERFFILGKQTEGNLRMAQGKGNE